MIAGADSMGCGGCPMAHGLRTLHARRPRGGPPAGEEPDEEALCPASEAFDAAAPEDRRSEPAMAEPPAFATPAIPPAISSGLHRQQLTHCRAPRLQVRRPRPLPPSQHQPLQRQQCRPPQDRCQRQRRRQAADLRRQGRWRCRDRKCRDPTKTVPPAQLQWHP